MEHRYQSRLKTDPTSTFQPAHNTHVQNPLKTMRREKNKDMVKYFLIEPIFSLPVEAKQTANLLDWITVVFCTKVTVTFCE